ncbi:hypothetical protein Nepgr_018624 [Nepenthes gracilis]|uniref:BAT2 N-terminal domain-containing protein n=1 Tax=Nepenthes gracilis TaxID=150966 RepID=A0AAD3XTK5_NEPGR|nr:hypothetical protein Nepgr_018624 [Nepenthes gracilis]
MTVLGKVVVPKPVNLPSQRLENHGLDPNIEIVPKGTLSWGSRPSAGSNAWVSSMLSPGTDASRPSSDGGTRPSTGGSEKSHDSITNTWGSNSRSSSASGAVMSNQTSSLHPCSAENRPSSSQLSRFAEPLAESSGPSGATDAAEKLGVESSMNDDFTPSFLEFPTLGSEKDHSGKNTDSADCGIKDCSRSSSAGLSSMTGKTATSTCDDASRNTDIKGRSVNSCRRDSHRANGPRPGMERRHGDPHVCPNPNVAPQHYEYWHGAPGANPSYRAPIYPGGFPMEPFPYYCLQVSAPRLANSQTVRPPGAFIGFVAYEGCHGPPVGLCNLNERDFLFMGMAAAQPAYNRYTNDYAVNDPYNFRTQSVEGRDDVEELVYEKGAPGEGDHSQSFDNKVSCSNPANMDSAIENVGSRSRDQTLTQKIASLNAKARASDGRHATNESNAGTLVYLERHRPTGVLVPVSMSGDRSTEVAISSKTTVIRRATHGGQVRGNGHVKGRWSNPEADRWRKTDAAIEFPSASSKTNTKVRALECPMVLQSTEMNSTNKEGKDDNASAGFDPTDCQGAKMRELARKRAIQLQKKEVEHTGEQKPKVLAKLEELNRRSQSCNNVAETGERNENTTQEFCAASCRIELHGRKISKQKRTGYKQKKSAPLQENSTEKSISMTQVDSLKDPGHTITNAFEEDVVSSEFALTRESKLPIESPLMADLSVHQRRKNVKSVRNKHKLLADLGKEIAGNVKLDASEVISSADSKDAIPSAEKNQSSLPPENTRVRENNSWKQHLRKMPRNSQILNKSAEKSHCNDAVIWAPVSSQHKIEVADDTHKKAAAVPYANTDNLVKNAAKSKRAEVERYVPKPLAKKLSQQGSIKLPSSIELQQMPKLDEHSRRGQHAADIVDPGLRGRGKRNPFKGWRGRGNSQPFDQKNSNGDHDEAQFPSVDTINTETSSHSLKENCAVRHWKPKSHACVAENQPLVLAPLNGNPVFPSEVSLEVVEMAATMDGPNEHSRFSRHHMNVNLDTRFSRGHRSGRDQSSNKQGNKRCYAQGFWGRLRKNSLVPAVHGGGNSYRQHRGDDQTDTEYK